MKKKALITGITGQDGSYLAEFLLEKGYEVHGIIRRSSSFNFERIDHLHNPEENIQSKIFMDYGDLADSNSLIKIIQKIKPDEIYHLGAQSHVRISFDIPEYTADVTGLGTIRILEAIRELKMPIKFYQAASSELYGKVVEIPQNEKTPFYPRSPYGCAKLYAYWVTKNYREAYNIFAVNGIMFNHESPRRGENFVSRKITKTLCEIKKGIKDVLYLGNLDAKRDWGYAKDYVEAMWLMLQQEKPEDYVIATGENHSVREFIEAVCKELGFDLEWQGEGVNEIGRDKNTGKTIIKINPIFFRPTEVDLLLGDATKARTKLGWQPKMTFKELVKLMVWEDMKKLEQKIYGIKIENLPEYSVYLKRENNPDLKKNFDFHKEIKIALIQPDSPFLTYPLNFPNLGLMYISAYLKKNGYAPDYYDLTGGGQLPENLKADIFGFSCQITQFEDVVEKMKKLRENNPHALFVIGGPFPTHSPQECLSAGFDIVVRGEGEIPMLEIIKKYPQIEKNIYVTDKFIDPDEIIPDWEAVNPLRYIYQLAGRRCINIMTKRGNCPFSCAFCAKQEAGSSPLRLRKASEVLAEARMLKEKYGFGGLAIYDDDIFVGNKERDKEIFRGLKQLDIKFRCMTRANLATREDIKFLKECGCEEICIGVESADPQILKIVNKRITIDENTQFVQWCKEFGLRVKAYLMIGLPNESRESVEKTKKWVVDNKVDNYDLSVFTPYPGSAIYHYKNNYEIDWDEEYLRRIWFSGEAQYSDCAVWTPYLSREEILQLKEEIHQECPRGKGGTTNYWGPIPELINNNPQSQPNQSLQNSPMVKEEEINKKKDNHMKYYLNEPYLKGKEKEYVLDVLESGWLSSHGKHTKIFEEKFAQLVGVEHALAVQSGTAALHTALLALGVGPGDKVVVPSFTCGGCATSVIQCGATPVILDVEEETFCLDVNKLKEFVKKEKPKVVVLVHIYGFPARDLEAITELCRQEGIFLLEDCCEAHGATYHGKKLGSFGEMSVFSVRSEKMIGVGEGGLVLTNNKELIDKANYWASRAAPYRGSQDPYWYKYYYSGVGMNYLMPHLLGAVGRAQIENFEEILIRKRKVGEKYQSLLNNVPGIKLQKMPINSQPSYWLNMVILKDKTKEEVRVIGEKLKENGVEIRPAFWPLGDQLFLKGMTFGSQEIGNYLFEHGLVLPSSVFLADNDCRGVEEIVKLLTESMGSVTLN